jgi:hypothetical protein
MASFSSLAFAVAGFSPAAFDFGGGAGPAWIQARKAAGRRLMFEARQVRMGAGETRRLGIEAAAVRRTVAGRRRWLIRR